MLDPVRNQLLPPVFSALVRRHRPACVADLGCGTAFVARRLLEAGAGRDVEWRFADKRKAALDFARRKWPPEVSASFHLCDFEVDGFPIGTVDLAFLTFTLMEVPVTDALADRLIGALNPQGKLVVVMPDTMQDILDSDSALLRPMLAALHQGFYSLEKTDKFTGDLYPFLIQRTETIVATLLRAGSRLISLDRLTLENGKATFVFTFERAD